jgi:hypothetical protein
MGESSGDPTTKHPHPNASINGGMGTPPMGIAGGVKGMSGGPSGESVTPSPQHPHRNASINGGMGISPTGFAGVKGEPGGPSGDSIAHGHASAHHQKRAHHQGQHAHTAHGSGNHPHHHNRRHPAHHRSAHGIPVPPVPTPAPHSPRVEHTINGGMGTAPTSFAGVKGLPGGPSGVNVTHTFPRPGQ